MVIVCDVCGREIPQPVVVRVAEPGRDALRFDACSIECAADAILREHERRWQLDRSEVA